MKRILKIGGLGFAALVAVLAVVGLFLPRQWHVEQVLVINAAPEHIHPFVTDLKQWQSWAAWTKDMDPEVKWDYGGPASGEGAWWSWKGPKMGQGKMTITKSDVSTGVWVDEMIETDKEVNARGALTWTREAEGTKVKWVDEGTLPPVIGGYFVGMIEDMLANNFQTGLKNLKTVAEKRRAAEQAQAAQPAPTGSAPEAAPAAP
ncbi:SRPBCC family protein [Hyalangium sp.]|uniref:SRPBCC family protein n=1 Tax=Hyalangium sp. TaxID=2028555 RepID=UPI002D3FC6FB|nr:SRPBCC family protein [Hyalangium sp.]HYH96201.1 SRPBCC family protein [Hyalangium sp.]